MLETNKIYNMDCIEGLKLLDDESVDAIVTDAPYHLTSIVKRFGNKNSAPAHFGTDGLYSRASKGFMGKEWDGGDIAFNIELWKECLRVLKSGGHLVAFGGTRTYHRMACAIEDAGFEIRDMIEWVYNTGFPKSLNIGKNIDKKPKADKIMEWKIWLKKQIDNCSKTNTEINDECGFTACSYIKTDNKDYWSSNLPKGDKWGIMKKVIGIDIEEYDWVSEDNTEERGFIESRSGLSGGTGNTVGCFSGKELSDNAIDENAQKFNGFGTALKPAHEPICLARKPLSEKTIVQQVLKNGCGGLDIDGTRIPFVNKNDSSSSSAFKSFSNNPNITDNSLFDLGNEFERDINIKGRFPANVIAQDDALNDGKITIIKPRKEKGTLNKAFLTEKGWNKNQMHDMASDISDSGSNSRYFDIDLWAKTNGIIQIPKPSSSERNKGLDDFENEDCGVGALRDGGRGKQSANIHPTVKSIALMSWLIKLISKEGDLVLDPFTGSGTTLIASRILSRNFIGFEKEKEYVEIAEGRLRDYMAQQKLTTFF